MLDRHPAFLANQSFLYNALGLCCVCTFCLMAYAWLDPRDLKRWENETPEVRFSFHCEPLCSFFPDVLNSAQRVISHTMTNDLSCYVAFIVHDEVATLLGDLHCGCVPGWNWCFPHCGWSVYKSKPDLGKHPLNIHILTRASVCLFQCGANLLYHSVFVCAAVPQTCLCLISWIKHAAWWSTYCTICGDSFLSLL